MFTISVRPRGGSAAVVSDGETSNFLEVVKVEFEIGGDRFECVAKDRAIVRETAVGLVFGDELAIEYASCALC